MPFALIAIIIFAIYLLSSIKILPEYERGVIFRLGRLLAEPKGPGIFLVFAPIDRMVRVSLRQEAFEVPPQDIITRDNVTLKVNAVVFLRVIELDFAENGAKRRLCELRSLIAIVEHFDDGAARLDHAQEHDRVHLQRDVVTRDDVLRRHLERFLAQRHAHHAIDRREHQEDARPLRLRKQTPESEDDAALVFGKDLDRAQQINGEDDDRDECEWHAQILLLTLPLRLFRRAHGFRNRCRHVLERVRGAERDAAFELPFVLRAIDADVVHARADDEADAAAAVIECAAVARVHGGIDAIRAGDEVERRHHESHAAIALDRARDESFEIRVRAVHARAVGVVDADAENEIALRDAHFDVHLDRHRRAGAEGDEVAAVMIGERDALENHLARSPALFFVRIFFFLWFWSTGFGRFGGGLRSRHLLQIRIDDANRIADLHDFSAIARY